MTKKEAIQILAILKAGYPNFYKDLTKEQASGTVNIWAMQFAQVPANIVLLAVNKLISTSTFPPSIAEVKKKIKDMYWEVWETLVVQEQQKTLSDKEMAICKKMIDSLSSFRDAESLEPKILDMMNGNTLLLGDGE